MSIRNKGIFFALEEMNEVIEENVDQSTVDTVEAAAEVSEQATVVEEHADVLENGVDDIAELETVKDVLQESVDSGEGASEDTAELAKVVVENICARLNMPATSFISVESFGSKNTRLTATKIAVETIGESIKKAWEAIKAFFKRVWEHIKNFFTTIWKALVAFKDSAKNLAVRVKNATFNAGEYVIPNGMTVQEYGEGIKNGTLAVQESVDAIKVYNKALSDLIAAAKKGDTEAVEKLVKENNYILGIETVATEGKSNSKRERQAALAAAADKAKAAEKAAQKLSEGEAKKMAEQVAQTVNTATAEVSNQAQVDAELKKTESANNAAVDTAIKESQEAQKAVEAGGEAAEEAKVKLSLWTKVKNFASKAFSYLSSFVTGVYKRVTALIKFGFQWVWGMVKFTGALAVGTAKGVYNAAVKGEA